MSFPWAARANTRTVRRRLPARSVRDFPRRHGLYRFIAAALNGIAAWYSGVACAEPPATALPVEAAQFVSSGTASISARLANSLTITQQSPRATLNWQSFNVGRDATVEFQQPDSSAVALNRIQQGSPSEIFGVLKANGEIYLINQNGILFGATARVDTHSLVASTHDVTDKIFDAGIADAVKDGKAAFEGTGPMGAITLEAGAVLKSAEGGRIMVFAPRIENRGEIHTPGGQAILAASEDQVYLASSDDPDLRGLLVEVKTGGSVENLGKIIAERGNVSIVGLAIAQNGIARATTAVNLNGSVHLLARDQVSVSGNGSKAMLPKHSGTLTLGGNSVTEVAPDDLAQRAVDAQDQAVSRIKLVGDQVTLKSGAQVVAPAGKVEIVATTIPDAADPGDFAGRNRTGSRILIEAGARVDVSGLKSAVIPMERNVITAELRGNELRDAPLQRNGVLRGQTVKVDVRQGTRLADLSGQIATIERPLDERLATGGTVSMISQGDVVLQPGATVDVSGGAVRYQDGFIETTQLRSQGRIFDIGSADPNRIYDGIVAQPRRRFEAGYVEGKDAGTIEMNAYGLTLDGALRGGVTTGRNQRLPTGAQLTGFRRPYDQLPLGGELILGRAGTGTISGLTDFTLGSLAEIGAEGMSRVRIHAIESISVPENARVELGPQGELTLDAKHVTVAGDIAAPGGKVVLGQDKQDSTLTLAAGARIEVAGRWINDSAALNPGGAPATPLVLDGGSVTLRAGESLILAAGSEIDADGGAWVQRDGKLKFGSGGDIVLAARLGTVNQVTPAPEVRLEGNVHAYAFRDGGTIRITAGGFEIGGGPGNAPTRTIYLAPAFFQSGGFRRYDLTATHDGITLFDGTTLTLSARNRTLASGYINKATGTALDRIGSIATLPDHQRRPVSLALTLDRDQGVDMAARVEIQTGAAIRAEPGASVALQSDTQLVVDGTIEAPSGSIDLRLVQPDSGNEMGFDRTQAIWLGEHGQLLAPAVFKPVPDKSGRGLQLGTMLDGGAVNIAAERGYFLAVPGSKIDVSGATRDMDVQVGVAYTPTAVNGAAGAIGLLAAEGMVLNGELRGARGSAPGAAGGSLSVTLDHDKRAGNVPFQFEQYPFGPREIIVSGIGVDAPVAGTAVPDDLNGKVRVDPAKVAAGGFDTLTLRAKSASTDFSDAAIKLEGDVELATARSLVLDAPVITSDGGSATLQSAYVRLGTAKGFFNPAAQTGTGSLLVRGQHVDIRGTLALRGFGPGSTAGGAAPVRIESEGDIRLIGGDEPESRDTGIYSIGRLNSAADVTLHADQVYAATATDFTLTVAGDDGKVTIESGGGAQTPLSAGSRIAIEAAHIEQRGTLRAPFGQIELNAAKSLTLADASLTSVSGDGQLVPFGSTEFGADWLYRVNAGSARVFESAPAKRIVTKAPDINIAPGSVVDVGGGGDLLAREHLPGPGGSKDILDANVAGGAFAILPARNSLFGYYDPQLSGGSLDDVGITVHLAGGGGIPAGEYAVLPAGYALLPGAYLVTPVATDAPVPGQAATLASGAAIVAGQRGAAGTDARDSLWSAYLIEDGAQVRNRAEYLESRADEFFADGNGPLNRDAGTLVIDAGSRLALGGRLANSAAGGRGSEVDIVANRLAVVTQQTGAAGLVEIVAADLNALNADSLLLGARRTHNDDALALDVRAAEVAVEAGAAIAAPEVMLAARDRITIANGATITAADGERVRAPETVVLTGDSAFARVSAGEQVAVERSASPGATGTLEVAAGARLSGARSITLDASKDVVVDGDLITDNGSLSLGAARISLGETDGVTGGLVLSNEDLARLNARDLILHSRGSIDLYGEIGTGQSGAKSLDVDHLALDAAGIAGYRNAGKAVSVRADTIALSNSAGVSFADTPDGSGSLKLAAREVTLGEGEFAVRGFGATLIAAGEQVVARPENDKAAALHVAGDLTLETPRLTATSGADVSIDTRDAAGAIVGQVNLVAPAQASSLAAAPLTGLGARIEITGTAIALDTHIEAPSGIVALHATGAGGVSLASGASIDAAGRDFVFDDLTVSSPGGHVALLADQGGVSIAGGARIDVSGGSAGGDAGKLSVSTPQGAFALDSAARLAATAAAGARAGSFVLDAASLPGGFSALNTALNNAGVTAVRDLRLRTGDVAIGADDLVRAHELRLAADGGKIDVFGRIDASGEQAGDVALFAGGDLSVHGSARVDAHATGAAEEGGTVVLASRDGRVTLAATDDAAATGVDVSGTREDGSKDDSGTVHLRARRDTETTVAVDRIATSIAGARSIDVEAVKTYVAQNVDTALIGTIKGETDTFMANATAIETALGKDADARIHLVPGVEVQSAGDLSVNADWDLLDWRYGGQAGVLTLRAAGNMNLDRSVSDGVKSASVADGLLSPRDIVQTGPSWSYRLAAGADLASADPLATKKQTDKGDLMLASGAKVRTGTGDIEIAAGRDLKLADSTAAIYTAGENRGPGAIPGVGDFGPEVTQELLYAADFLHHGGDIHIDVARNVQGANGGQFVNQWLARVGNTINALPTGDNVDLGVSWAVAVGSFEQNVGALGGGDVTIEAGGSLNNLSVVIPTTGQPTGGVGTAPLVAGGGDMRIEAGDDILGGSYYLGWGKAHISAGGSLAASDSRPALPTLALGDGQFTIAARKHLGIETIVNPTVLPMNPAQGSPDVGKLAADAYFFTYGPNSAVQLTSIAGDVTLRGDGNAITSTFGNISSEALTLYPGSLSVRSLQGDVLINKSLTLMPSVRGDLELLAQNSIRPGDANTTVSMSDADPAVLPGILKPAAGLGDSSTGVSALLAMHAANGLHKGDSKPVRIVARTGDIGSLPDSANKLSLLLAKQAHVITGGDIVNLALSVQHMGARDVSVVQAGGDIVFPTPRSGDGSVNAAEGATRNFRFAGPGQVYILAGRDVDLGAAGGIASIGNMENPTLPDGGASITVMTGQRTPPAYDAFIEKYLAAGGAYGDELAAYMRALGSGDESIEAFRALPLTGQRKLILEILFSELREAGKLAAQTGRKEDYERGYDAIRTLFPGDSYPGDLKSFLSQIYTRDGGDINLIVPGGLVNAGVASSTAVNKQANELGIVAERDGDINAVVHGDFLVNQSRVFALDGGDIVIWSSIGDIDAGRGAKTALAVPAAEATTDAFGKTVVEFPPAISGSGIKASVRTLGREPGDVFLIAPVGVVDAGDAGIEAAGNLTIAATAVLGASNIKVGGVSTGVPLADSGASAVSASVGAAAAAVAKSGDDGATTKRAVMDKEGNISIIEVEVIGFGDEDGKDKKDCGAEDKDCHKG
jgi:filamentous hemagglutinin family protein